MSKVIKITDYEQWNDIIKKCNEDERHIIIDFTATWCGPCNLVAPIFEEFSEKFPNITFLKVDVDDNEQIVDMFGVDCMPTFKLVKNQQIVGTVLGADVQQLFTLLDNVPKEELVEEEEEQVQEVEQEVKGEEEQEVEQEEEQEVEQQKKNDCSVA